MIYDGQFGILFFGHVDIDIMKLHIFLIFLLAGCNTSTKDFVCTNQFINDSIKKDVPDIFNDSKRKSIRTNFINAVGMCELEKGFDSLQIRVEYTTIEFVRILTISKAKKKWLATLSTIYWDKTGQAKSVATLKRRNRILQSSSNWSNFDAFINDSEIMKMSDARELAGYYISTDATSLLVEIATKDIYKIYDYPDLLGNLSNNNEAKKMEQIIKKVEKEFSFKFEE